MLRRRSLGALALAWPVASIAQAAGGCAAPGRKNPPSWPAWADFRDRFMSRDGRIIDPGAEDTTTSEGQAYALFFALVADDRPAFERLLRWTEDNLAGGDLSRRLPAWQWGRRKDGGWGVLDANAASDADLWMAYTLAQSARLWNNRRHGAMSRWLADRILAEEVVDLPGLGTTLLPGPQGFRIGEQAARLNPSYLPLPLLRWFAEQHPGTAWADLLPASLKLLHASAPHGFSPDWVVYEARTGWRTDTLAEEERLGGYNAIRVYLWLGLTDAGDPARAALLERHAPMARLTEVRGAVPERVDPRLDLDRQIAAAPDNGPAGFQAALLPLMRALGRSAGAAVLADRLAADPPRPDHYYGQALSLFALGFTERRYRFGADGSLLPDWTPCDSPPGSSSR